MSCGKGVQQQLLQCVRLSDDGLEEEVDLSFCTNINLTIPIRECDMDPCGFLEWGAGDWSGVSTYEIFYVSCIGVVGQKEKKIKQYIPLHGVEIVSDPKQC